MKFVIISGLSGSGKSVALRALEDCGFYCVDNLPLALLADLTHLLALRHTSTAVSIDVRNLPETPEILDIALKKLPSTFAPQLLFLYAEVNALVRRYSDTRRIHPLLNRTGFIESAIREEGRILGPLEHRADLIIDTSIMSVHELTRVVQTRMTGQPGRKLTIVFVSFGYKYGIPIDADYVFDVRFLPNPHWDPMLRPLTGLDQPIKTYLEQHAVVKEFIERTSHYVTYWLPMLEQNNRSYLTIAIGCTGGRHRSVYVADQLAAYFSAEGREVQICHRTLEKPGSC